VEQIEEKTTAVFYPGVQSRRSNIWLRPSQNVWLRFTKICDCASL